MFGFDPTRFVLTSVYWQHYVHVRSSRAVFACGRRVRYSRAVVMCGRRVRLSRAVFACGCRVDRMARGTHCCKPCGVARGLAARSLRD